MKYLLLIVLGLGAWWFLRFLKRKGETPARVEVQTESEAMAACAHCGVYGPLSDMVPGEGGVHYCSDAHRRLGPAPGRKG